MSATEYLEKILVLDFGAQYAHLICRRIRELGVYAELVPYDIDPESILRKKARGLIFSGGPKSVYSKGAPLPDEGVYKLGIPILGICYGLQAVVQQSGGVVVHAKRKEFGKASIELGYSVSPFSEDEWVVDLLDEPRRCGGNASYRI